MNDNSEPPRSWEEVLLLAQGPKFLLSIQEYSPESDQNNSEFPIIEILKSKGYIKYLFKEKNIFSGKTIHWYKLTFSGKQKQIELKQ